MILGRSPALWAALVGTALNALVIVAGVDLSALQVGALNALALAVIGIMANESDNRTVPTFAPTLQDRRDPTDPAGTPGVGRRTDDPEPGPDGPTGPRPGGA